MSAPEDHAPNADAATGPLASAGQGDEPIFPPAYIEAELEQSVGMTPTTESFH